MMQKNEHMHNLGVLTGFSLCTAGTMIATKPHSRTQSNAHQAIDYGVWYELQYNLASYPG